MKAPLSWLRDFAPIEGSPLDLADRLNGIGLIVEGIAAPGRDIAGVRTARVLAVEKHPDADRLALVDVDPGDGEAVRVVCGAHNYVVGDIVPWAPPGAELPGGFMLERRKIRGQFSDGMLCAPDELGLSDDHSGIMILPPDTPLGDDLRSVLGLDDIVFDLEITPNRPDAMSIAGVARDLAAALGVPFTLPVPSAPGTAEAGPPDGEWATLVVEAPDRCPRYVARCGTVAVGPSPGWMAQRLTKAGMRPISNVVDVTNYVMLERGQPLHAFDLARLGGRGIVVRLAGEGEKITTLDGVERTLTAADLLICDANRAPQAIAGVMGAGDSEVSDTTTELLLESAYFTPDGILRTSKHLGLRTESSARFERGVDPNGTAIAADRAWELFAEVASSQAAAGTLDAYPAPIEAIRVSLRTARVNDVLGTDLDTATIRGHLEPLGFTVPEGVHADGHGGVVEYVVPTYRPDCEREIDLIEEVARHHGYNNIARTLPRMKEPSGGLTPVQLGRRAVRDALLGTGLSEAYTFSLVAPADLAAAGLPPEGIELENPLRAEESLLRPAVLPGLLKAAAFNAGHALPDVGLFEIGHIFLPPPPGQTLPDEREHVAVVLTGTVFRLPHEPNRPVDGHDVVGRFETVAEALALADWRLRPGDAAGFAPGRAAHVVVDGAAVGAVGEIDPAVLARIGLAGPAAALEVNLSQILGATRKERRSVTPSRYPASTIDLAFVLDEPVPAGAAQRTLSTTAGDLLEDVRLFDVFRSEVLGPNKKSLAFGLRFRAPDRTLTDEEVGGLRQRLIDAMAKEHGAVLRG
ncbi:MAG TPA: phenylalanine--tRNA ligase subunit beta [Acidimicrobiia bacterium]|nr:phenylalanine--tRNA ligase subunit beta [Acidimicrobiia bacterium]